MSTTSSRLVGKEGVEPGTQGTQSVGVGVTSPLLQYKVDVTSTYMHIYIYIVY